MSHPRQFSRRHLLATSAAFATAATLNPFPKVVSPRSAAAQELTPAPAESQVIRWAGPPTRGLSIPVYDNFWWTNLQSVYMTPFVQDNSGEISPGICTDYTVSDDQLTYTFTMNPDAVWSDGSKITASDVKYTWDWMANPKLSGNPFNYYQTQAVKGNREVFEGTASEMSGLVALDDDTLQITLSRAVHAVHLLLHPLPPRRPSEEERGGRPGLGQTPHGGQRPLHGRDLRCQ